MRSGKRLASRTSEVVVQFRDVPHQAFPDSTPFPPNRLVLHLQPDEGITLCMQAKRPGLEMQLSPVAMRFRYRDAFREASPEAYETLLLDAIQGDATLFMRADQVEAAWRIVAPVLTHWAEVTPDFPNYSAGSWGPDEADKLLSAHGRAWWPCGTL